MGTDPWGVDDGYWDIRGTWHDTSPEVRRSLWQAMGSATGDDGPPRGAPVWFVRHGTAPEVHDPAELLLEDGTELDVAGRLPADLPLGYHDLVPADGGPTTRLIVVPHRMAPAPERVAAVATQLYATWSRASWGIGDLGDLAALGRWGAGRGIGALLVSPLHAPLPIAAPEPSPYFASSRCWRSPLHLRVEEVPGFDPGDPVLADLADRGRALGADHHIDRRAVWALKRAALRRIWERARPTGRELARWRAEQGEALTVYATFCALADHHGTGWSTWPVEHRHPGEAGVARFAADHPAEVAFHAWLQWLCDRQHRAAAGVDGVGLIHDLAIGAAPDGADAWVWQDLLAPGVRVGAPPDEFNAAGQDWGLPPFVPWRLRDACYQPLAHLFRSSFRHAAGLRVDHVMGLFRLWWIPAGCGPADGGYVRFPGHELLDVLALESVRAGAFVIGEDLGTVEDEVRAALADRSALSYRVAWFEDRPPEDWPWAALAAVTTHDLPTVAGVWSGTDEQAASFRGRLSWLVGDPWPASAAEASERLHRRLARAPSAVVSATMEDLLGVADRPNVPGTTTEHTNWSTPLPIPIDDLNQTDAPTIITALTT